MSEKCLGSNKMSLGYTFLSPKNPNWIINYLRRSNNFYLWCQHEKKKPSFAKKRVACGMRKKACNFSSTTWDTISPGVIFTSLLSVSRGEARISFHEWIIYHRSHCHRTTSGFCVYCIDKANVSSKCWFLHLIPIHHSENKQKTWVFDFCRINSPLVQCKICLITLGANNFVRKRRLKEGSQYRQTKWRFCRLKIQISILSFQADLRDDL